VGIDVVHPDAPLDGYAVVVAPALYQLTRPQAERLRALVAGGGALVMSYFSGVADEREHIWLGGYPALLQDVLGLRVEEWQPLGPGEGNVLAVGAREVACEKFCELLHLNGAEALATYAREFYAGRPAVTRHRYQKGEAVYVATQPARDWLTELLGGILRSRGLTAPLRADPGVELARRATGAQEFLFVVNHNPVAAAVEFQEWSGEDILSGRLCCGPVLLEPFGVRVLRRDGIGGS
jgi:beta-galactosidase